MKVNFTVEQHYSIEIPDEEYFDWPMGYAKIKNECKLAKRALGELDKILHSTNPNRPEVNLTIYATTGDYGATFVGNHSGKIFETIV